MTSPLSPLAASSLASLDNSANQSLVRLEKKLTVSKGQLNRLESWQLSHYKESGFLAWVARLILKLIPSSRVRFDNIEKLQNAIQQLRLAKSSHTVASHTVASHAVASHAVATHTEASLEKPSHTEAGLPEQTPTAKLQDLATDVNATQAHSLPTHQKKTTQTLPLCSIKPAPLYSHLKTNPLQQTPHNTSGVVIHKKTPHNISGVVIHKKKPILTLPPLLKNPPSSYEWPSLSPLEPTPPQAEPLPVPSLSSKPVEDHLSFQDQQAKLLALLKSNSVNMENIPPPFNADKKFVLAAIIHDAWALKYSEPKLQGDKEVVLASVAQFGPSLLWATDELKDDKEVVLAAITQQGQALKYASNRLKDDKELVLIAVNQYGRSLEFASDNLKSDIEVVSAAIKQCERALQYASVKLLGDKTFMLQLVNLQPTHVLVYAPEELRNEKELVLATVALDGHSLHYASPNLKNDKEVVLAAVFNSGIALQYASEALKDDKQIVMAAVTQDSKALQFASNKLKGDKDVQSIVLNWYWRMQESQT